ncbi:hypothetical protein FD722_17505 [Photobacterium damselae subsp. damselae]|uniref:hypothetical protein n=1 Tax=Photobacterium damselae TaxID=38293 RepID=UPI000D04BFF6|nr:hypothetical protein [Photobacterium damselae]PSB76999.1 hypothetical protein C5F61_13540 [Photobacterium damselae subsp. damselae]TLS80842.1 hypothetical protein FD719_17520 [Photobacterium damselae subsp. damselae]TLS87215.1 hypothetical protein FD722_17505 [Photobacterium damselae subsp. damselae]
MITNIYKKIKYCNVLSTVSTVPAFLSRTKFDQESKKIIEQINDKKSRLPSIAAIYRVKNGAVYIESSILSIAPLCTEIIFIDNQSSDSTLDIVNRLKNELQDICEIKIYSYNKKIRIAGDGYKSESSNDVSLADFYNYCFSLGESEYLMKVDCHYIFTLKGLEVIQKKIKIKPRFLNYRGVEIFGKKLSFETFLYKNDNNFKYVDSDFYEKLTFKYKISLYEKVKNTIFFPIYIHVKRLSFVKIKNSSVIIKELYK